MNKKICHITTVHSPFDIRIFHKECKTLAKAGYKVVLIARHDKDETVEGVQIVALPSAKNKISRMALLAYGAFRRALQQKASVYHLHDPELVPYGLLLALFGRTVVYDAHEDWPRNIMNKKNIPPAVRQLASRLFDKLENFASKRFGAVIAATNVIRDRFVKLGCNTVDVKNYPILNELHMPEIQWTERERVVCYVGRIDRIRGGQEMIGAIGQTGLKLLLAGYFTPPGLRDEMATMSGWDKVDYLGVLDRTEVASVLSRSVAGLVLLHPISNYLESLPIKMFEYMSAGIPVIASDFPLWKEIVEGNKCGICVDPMNINAIAEAIGWIMDHPEEAQQMGDNGRKAVEEKYNWEIESGKLIGLYREVLHG